MRCVAIVCRVAASSLALSAMPLPAQSPTSQPLAAKAERLQAIIEQKTVQEHGLIPMFVRASDFQLPTAEDYAGSYRHRHLLGKTEAEVGLPPMHVWRAWENTSADTAFYLGAMAYKYRCTGDPATLAICRRTLAGLERIHQMGVENGDRGFLCKPYGGRFSRQTSGDQVQCVVVGLSVYRPIAPPEDCVKIDQIVADFANHQIETEYTAKYGYFAHPRAVTDWSKVDWSDGLIYVPLLQLGWSATGNDRHVEEIDRWYRACGTDKLSPVPTGVFQGYVAYRMLYLPALMMEYDPAHHALWRSFMRNVYRTCRTGIQPDGTTYSSWTHDSATGVSTPKNPGWGGGPTRTGRSAIFAKGCVQAARWLPEEPLVQTAREILEHMEVEEMRFVMSLKDGPALAREWQAESRMLDHDCLTAWLWAYWEGRWRSYW